MNTNMKELNLNEMEQVNGGSITVASAAAVVAVAAAAIRVASFVYDCVTDK